VGTVPLLGFFAADHFLTDQHINELIDRAPITRPPVSKAGSQRLPLSPAQERILVSGSIRSETHELQPRDLGFISPEF